MSRKKLNFFDKEKTWGDVLICLGITIGFYGFGRKPPTSDPVDPKKYSSEKMDMFLAFDNDPAGKGYIRQFQERYSGVLFTLDLPPQEGQDWNDVLQSNQSMKMKAVAPL